MNPILPTFEGCVAPYLERMLIVELSEAKKAQVDAYCLKAVNSFIKATGKQPEDLSSWVQMRKQISAEAAIEEYLGIDFVDYETLNQYHQYTSQPFREKYFINYFDDGVLPIIYRNNQRARIFLMVLNQKATAFVLCGLATKRRLNSFRSYAAVPAETPGREIKASFYGFDEMQPFTDLDTLDQAFYS